MSASSGSKPASAPRTSNHPDIHADILLVVFCGGTIGTALRYAFAQIPAAGPSGGVHLGTLAANLLACFCYAGLTAFLAGSPRIAKRRKELASRGLGMGLCGGLSTMSTLALECFTSLHSGDSTVVASGFGYLVVTFALGLVCALIGAKAGLNLASGAHGASSDGGRLHDAIVDGRRSSETKEA